MSTDDALGALEVLKSNTFKKAFKEAEADIIVGWKNSRPLDSETREKLWMQLKQLEAVRDRLQSFVDSAKL